MPDPKPITGEELARMKALYLTWLSGGYTFPGDYPERLKHEVAKVPREHFVEEAMQSLARCIAEIESLQKIRQAALDAIAEGLEQALSD